MYNPKLLNSLRLYTLYPGSTGRNAAWDVLVYAGYTFDLLSQVDWLLILKLKNFLNDMQEFDFDVFKQYIEKQIENEMLA
jgi:hypothetical protein